MSVRTLSRRCAVLTAVLVAAALALPVGPAAARETDTSAKSFLSGIYQSYVGNSTQAAKGVALDSPEAVKRYFSHGLASVILEDGDAVARPGVGLVLGSDPFVGRDAWDIADLKIDVKEAGPAKAVGTVSFSNFGKPESVTVELMKVGTAWRVSEIKWGPLTLRGLYKTKWQASRPQAALDPAAMK
ncbi:hypothetical protein CCR97_19545 [Rhodoplanes elegans]|uniref:DUF3828 domain-containing protein n=1 Tax=Rhodoplanes elegans TaxID=29408 RepID=A0A327KCA3_9BRAD|nr:hypothetical protein [Rhodoplanes elegans]MBK5960372.1 hypothetical protein [Rhodoplanes elegans]RAI35771.1 hypothetical protein CH338_18700 [Rhodoplanes elegans]